MSNLSSNIQNIEASRSSIEDADFAAEVAGQEPDLGAISNSYASSSQCHIAEYLGALEISLPQ